MVKKASGSTEKKIGDKVDKKGKAKDDGEEKQPKVLYCADFILLYVLTASRAGKERPKGSHCCQCTTYTVRKALQSNRGSAENTGSVPWLKPWTMERLLTCRGGVTGWPIFQ